MLGATPSISIFNSVDRSSFGISNYLEDEDSISRWLPVWLGGIVDPVIHIYIYICVCVSVGLFLYLLCSFDVSPER